MEIREKILEDRVILTVIGRIDTNTSRQLQERLLNGFQKSGNVRLDLREVDYVSSAGLRVFLIGEKTAKAKQGSLKLFHVQEQVREVLKMTGFDKVLEIWDDIR